MLTILLARVVGAEVPAQAATCTKPPVMVINAGYQLVIDAEKGSLASFRSTFGTPRDQLIPNHASLPLFKIEFMSDEGKFQTVTSSEARKWPAHIEDRACARVRFFALPPRRSRLISDGRELVGCHASVPQRFY